MTYRGQHYAAGKPTVYNMRFYMYVAIVLPSTYTHLDMEVTAIAGNDTEAPGEVPTQEDTKTSGRLLCQNTLGYGTA